MMLPSLDVQDLPWKLIIFIGIFFAIRAYLRGAKYNNFKPLNGKVIVVTGANSGLGYEITKILFQRGANVIMACRDLSSGEKIQRLIYEENKSIPNDNLKLKKLDLNSFISIQLFVDDIKKEFKHIDVLINNAGVMMHPLQRNSNGIEIHFMVNYLGPCLLTFLLLPLLKRGRNGGLPPSQIVNISSPAYKVAKLDMDSITDKQNNFSMDSRQYFAQSKLALTLMTKILSQRLEGDHVSVNACIPGICFTNIMRHLPFFENKMLYFLFFPFLWFLTKTAYDGAQTILYCATDENVSGITGCLFKDYKPEDINLKRVQNQGTYKDFEEDAKVLWAKTLEICQLKDTDI